MSKTGDILKNIEELNRELKKIQYQNKLPVKVLQSGNPEVYLPIIHYTLFKYSAQVAQFLADNSYDLFAKNDYDFISSAFNALIKLFNYKPCITLDSFFSKGSAENKVILCCNIIQLVQAKHTDLSRKGSKTKKSISDHKLNNTGYPLKPISYSPKEKDIVLNVEPDYQQEEERMPSSPKFNTKGELNNEKEIYIQPNEGKTNNYIQYNNNNDQVEEFESSQELSLEHNNYNSNMNSNVYSSKNKIEDSSDQYNQMHQSCKCSQQNGIDFSALVQVINTLSSSVSQMANKVEKFKITIEDRLSKIEAEVSLIKNNQSILENKCNSLLNNAINIDDNYHIFNSNKDDEIPSKVNEQIISFAADVHSLDLSNKKDTNDKGDPFYNSPSVKAQFNHNPHTINKYNSNQYTNYEDTDRLIENVEKKFKETQKLLSEFNS